MALLHALTPLVEQISIDEAFLDVSDRPEPAEQLARQLQQRIRSRAAPALFAGRSEQQARGQDRQQRGQGPARGDGPPNAILVVPPGQEAAFLAPLPATPSGAWDPRRRNGWRAGHSHHRRHRALADADLVRRFGKNGHDLAHHARGLDDRPIVTEHERKSVSQETTFERDIEDGEALRRTLRPGRRREPRAQGQAAGRSNRQAQAALGRLHHHHPPDHPARADRRCRDHRCDRPPTFRARVERRAIPAVRLIGVGVTGFQANLGQRSLWDQPDERAERLELSCTPCTNASAARPSAGQASWRSRSSAALRSAECGLRSAHILHRHSALPTHRGSTTAPLAYPAHASRGRSISSRSRSAPASLCAARAASRSASSASVSASGFGAAARRAAPSCRPAARPATPRRDAVTPSWQRERTDFRQGKLLPMREDARRPSRRIVTAPST